MIEQKCVLIVFVYVLGFILSYLIFLGESPVCGVFAYSDRSLCLSYACRVVYCGQTVQDKPIVCIAVEYECGDEISIGSIFDALGPPNEEVEFGDHDLTLE